MSQRLTFDDPADVYVHRASTDALDVQTLTTVLGEPPLDLRPPIHPTIFVAGRIHTAATAWLASRSARSPATLATNATSIATWIKWLRDERGYTHPHEGHADVFRATEADLQQFYADSQHRRGSAWHTGPSGWRTRNSAIKQFHEFAQLRYRLPLPYTPVSTASGGTSTGLAPRTRQSSAGLPVEPLWAQHLVDAAAGITADGTDLSTETSERDTGVVSLALGAGLRRGTIHATTIFEIPHSRPGRLLNKLLVPDFITKGDAGGMALVMERRMDAVRDYITGSRRHHVQLFDASELDNPITLTEVRTHTWTGIDRDGVQQHAYWAQTDAEDRMRMVTPDGEPAVIFLRVTDGHPMSYRNFGHVIDRVKQFTIDHIEPDFPPHFRLHDCRHTFAVHMVCALVRKRLDGEFANDAVTEAMSTALIGDAIDIVAASLGHATDTTTRKIYLVTAAMWLFEDDINPSHFLAEFN